jgi:hypothetical protein
LAKEFAKKFGWPAHNHHDYSSAETRRRINDFDVAWILV